MWKLDVRNLTLEITRRCNMSCIHCLRGEAENVDMTENILQAVLAPISHISTITFTGGEPALQISCMENTLRIVKERGIPVNSGFLATNGLQVTDQFLSICDQ